MINEDEYVKPKLYNNIRRGVKYIDAPLYYYQQRISGITKCGFNVKRLDKIKAIYQNILFFRDKGITKYIDEELKYFCLYYFMYVYRIMHDEQYTDVDLTETRNIYKKVFWLLMKSSAFDIRYKYMLALYRFFPNYAASRYAESYMCTD